MVSKLCVKKVLCSWDRSLQSYLSVSRKLKAVFHLTKKSASIFFFTIMGSTCNVIHLNDRIIIIIFGMVVIGTIINLSSNWISCRCNNISINVHWFKTISNFIHLIKWYNRICCIIRIIYWFNRIKWWYIMISIYNIIVNKC